MSDRTNNTSPGPGPAVDEQAAHWDARLRAHDCTDQERQQFKAWCGQSPAHQQRFDDLEVTLGLLRSAINVPEIRSMREAALDAARPSFFQRPRTQWSMAVAAGFGLVAVGLLWLNVNNDQFDGGISDAPPIYATAIGERSTRTLTDGTVAELNTNTRIEVAYTDSERLVTLLQGQALFDVAKNPDRPFIVIAGDQRITAVGTIFDVRYEHDEVKVTLVEGIVEVRKEIPSGPLSHRIEIEPVRLVAGQQLATSAEAPSSAPIVSEANVERETIWREGRVFFDDAALPEAIAEMNRYYTIQIIVDDPDLDKYRVNGMFLTGRQANFVSALEAYYPVESRTDDYGQILLISKRNQ